MIIKMKLLRPKLQNNSMKILIKDSQNCRPRKGFWNEDNVFIFVGPCLLLSGRCKGPRTLKCTEMRHSMPGFYRRNVRWQRGSSVSLQSGRCQWIQRFVETDYLFFYHSKILRLSWNLNVFKSCEIRSFKIFLCH